ncbi:ribosomal protein S18-alanine N-acetyltransferase [Eremococcus coleocola]|uniref:[Ribosomal protein bS18]-alanine N-acetyltransferase n=1 Tax=Eremococcus coleocola ACS-139-V-Col8 TaxID=908337 RepID=E4KQP2_9LACT|nr:ribosomal protein S18-alanine N-acetyltransferase [Eremococcus coleocola]EFR30728.1 ribosomal-protein-alanine acetyltransferase [Eremococcus coleocola ACS-139-V-Col8]
MWFEILASQDLTADQQTFVAEQNQSLGWTLKASQADFTLSYSYYACLVSQAGVSEFIAYIAYHHLFEDITINQVWVAPECRGQGIGSRLLQDWLASLPSTSRVTLEVRQGNQAARALYTKYNFKVIDQRPAYYHDPREDAIIMQWCISEGIF